MNARPGVLFYVGWVLFAVGAPFGAVSPAFLVLLIETLRLMASERASFFTRDARLSILLGGVVLISLVSALASNVPLISLATVLGYTLGFTVIVLGAGRLVDETDFFRQRFLPLLVWSTALSAAFGLFDYFVRGSDRASTLFAWANYFATLLLISTGIVLGYLQSSRRTKWFALPFLLLTSAALLFSKSRGGWLGFGAMGAILALKNRQTALLLVLVLGLAVTAVVNIPSLASRAQSIVSLTVSSNLTRLYIWSSAVKMFVDHSWLGVGPGAFFYNYPKYEHPEIPERHSFPHAHNAVLNVLVENGVLGFLAFTALALELGLRSWRLLHRPDWLGVGAAAALAGVAVQAQVDVTVNVFETGMAFWFLVGLVAALARTEPQTTSGGTIL